MFLPNPNPHDTALVKATDAHHRLTVVPRSRDVVSTQMMAGCTTCTTYSMGVGLVADSA